MYETIPPLRQEEFSQATVNIQMVEELKIQIFHFY